MNRVTSVTRLAHELLAGRGDGRGLAAGSRRKARKVRRSSCSRGIAVARSLPRLGTPDDALSRRSTGCWKLVCKRSINKGPVQHLLSHSGRTNVFRFEHGGISITGWKIRFHRSAPFALGCNSLENGAAALRENFNFRELRYVRNRCRAAPRRSGPAGFNAFEGAMPVARIGDADPFRKRRDRRLTRKSRAQLARMGCARVRRRIALR